MHRTYEADDGGGLKIRDDLEGAVTGPDERGILYPDELPTFTRRPAPDDLADRVRWFWIPRWTLRPGQTSRQRLLPFPVSNLVVQADGITLSGPATGAAHRDLTGTGWAVGATLRPAGIASLHPDPRVLRDCEIPFDAPELDCPDLHSTVAAAMDPERPDSVDTAVAAVGSWCRDRLGVPDEPAILANSMEELISTDRRIVRVDQVADRLSLSVRTVQRLAKRYIGLPPLAVIRRYRLQEAAQRLRDNPSLTIASVAADVGYADHAHLTSDFRKVLGFTPHTYRSPDS